VIDESEADDGAIYAFWDFIQRRRDRGEPSFDLERVSGLGDALAAYEGARP
jgi:hypothetical protein